MDGITGNCTTIGITEEVSKKASEIKSMKGYGIGAVDCFTIAAGSLMDAKVLTGYSHMKDMENVIYLE